MGRPRGRGNNGLPSKDRRLDRHLDKRDRHLVKGNRRPGVDPYDFVCVDGEGLAAAPDQAQPYVLMVSSTGDSISSTQGLSTGQVFEWLFGLGKRSLWVFGGTYDINQWLRDLKPNQLERLRDSSNHCITKWGFNPTYTIKHIYGKMLQVSRPKVPGQLSTIRVWDMLSYVQMSFVSMIQKWHLAENPTEEAEINEIARMKEQRSNFTAADIPVMRQYSLLEVKYLQRAVQKLISLTEATGYLPDVWYSPGSIAAVAMEKHGVLSHHGDIPDEVMAIAEAAYHGGRAEIACIGKVEGPIYDYDIHSAYPAAAITLPSFAGGSWERYGAPGGVTMGLDLDDPDLVALCQVSWQRPPDGAKTRRASRDFGPFPVRIACGSKRYPYEGGPEWYWSSEVVAAEGITDIRVHDAWVFHPATDVKPFAYLAEMYRLRASMKEPEHYDGREIVYKLLMNSTYGKLAQHPIDEKQPRYRHLLWAGMITAITRARLLETASYGNILSFATDGVLSRRPLPVKLSDDLGAWGVEKLDWVFLVQSGYYFTPDEVRTRGISRITVDPAAVMAAWERGEATFTVHQDRFLGYRTALRQGPETWRTWASQEKRIEFTLAPRREMKKRSGAVQWSRAPKKAICSVWDLIFHDPTEFKDSYRADEELYLEQPEVDEDA